ncbi:MAG: cellulase-like family protein [Candidatus Latescibacterota bacterium]|jgi:hypothetical protein
MRDATPVFAADRLPEHLPERLTISCWIWGWIVAATPGEPYHDLERAVLETRDRGFNAVRVEVGLNWAFTPEGKRRGPVELGPWIAGHGWNFSSVNALGGGRHDVLDRVLRLLELAARHGLRVILTSWEYQDSTWFVADPALRSEVYGIPLEQRFLHLARHHDRLLSLIEGEGLDQTVAFVEVHNEPEHSDFPKGETSRQRHEEAIAFLRARHPRILFSGDFSSHDWSIVPNNAQVFDQHVYAGGEWYFQDLYGSTVLHPEFDPQQPRRLPVMDQLMRQDLVPWDEFMKPAQNVRPFWRPIMWLFENLDNQAWDAWVAERFAVWRERIERAAAEMFAADAAEARQRSLPLVMDEGGLFYPPRLSRFEVTGEGLSLLDRCADLALEHGYWGFMPGTYCAADHLVWHENPEWLRQINGRFLQGG